MVPASVAGASRPRRRGRSLRAPGHAAPRVVGLAVALVYAALTAAGAAPSQAPPLATPTDSTQQAPPPIRAPAEQPPPPKLPSDVRWTRAFLTGGVARKFADTRALNLGPGQPAELYVTLEGEGDGLPLYCCMLRELRVDGRAIPARLVVDPETAGIAGAEIEWIELRPTPDARGWRSTRFDKGRNQWALPVTGLPGDPDPGIDPVEGTARFAASVRWRNPDATFTSLATDGWSVRPEWADPRSAPGFRVSRFEGNALLGRALGLARLPFVDGATNEHAWERVALRPADLFLCAYEDLSGGPLPGAIRVAALDGPEWSWLLLDVVQDAHKRKLPTAPVVGALGRPVPWAKQFGDTSGVTAGDVVIASGKVAILERDDGDGWLGNGDHVLHGMKGRLARGTLADLPEGAMSVRRSRGFQTLAKQLSDAGYGPLEEATAAFSPALRRAVRAFQRDHELPDTGLPDEATLRSLEDFLARVAGESAAAGDSTR